MITPSRRPLRQSEPGKWETIRYAIDRTARTARLCAIMLVRGVPPGLIALLICRRLPRLAHDKLGLFDREFALLGQLVWRCLLSDPGQVVGVSVGDGPGRDAGHFVGVFFLGQGDDLRHSVAPRLQ